MNFLIPGAFLLALLIPPVIAMYLLKLRRTEQEISSIYLWKRMVRDFEANAPWQRLKHNLLLVFQLLFLIALIFASARPFIWQDGFSGKSIIIIIDTSASMAAEDVKPNRLEEAKKQARGLISDLPEQTRLTLIESGSKARLLLTSSLDRRQANLTINSLSTTTTTGDIEVALQLATAIASRQPETEVIIISDGSDPISNRINSYGETHYIPVGAGGENQAISLISLTPSPNGLSTTALIQVTNYGPSLAYRRLAVFSDGELFDTFDLSISAGEVHTTIVENMPHGMQVAEARLTGGLQNDDINDLDDLPIDDRAYAPLPNRTPIRIRLVTNGNIFLETAVSLLPGVELVQAMPDLFQTEAQEEFNLTIYDGYAHDTIFPPGNLLFIGPLASTQFFTVTGAIVDPQNHLAATDITLTKDVSMEETNIRKAVNIPLPGWAQAAIFTYGSNSGQPIRSPLLFFGETDNRRIAVLAFDLHQSDFPLQISFPILVANLVEWLAPQATNSIPSQINPGEMVIFPVSPTQANSVTITLPDGKTTQISSQSGKITFADTARLGVYQVHLDDNQSIKFAVNMYSPAESNIEPDNALSPTISSSNPAHNGEQLTRLEWWRPLIIGALILLMIEWLVYHRSTLILIFHRSKTILANYKKS